MRPLALLALLPLLASTPALAADPVDITLLASLDVSRFSGATAGFSELTDGPGAARDGDPGTAWIVPGAEGEHVTLTLDWSSGSGPAPYALDSLRLVLVPADAAVTVEIGPDRGNLARAEVTLSPENDGQSAVFTKAPRPRVLRLGFPAGTMVASLGVLGTAPIATLSGVSGTCDDRGVHLAVEGQDLFGLRATRALDSGADLRLDRRIGGSIDDATVRFDPRPQSYTYAVSALGSDAPAQMVTVACEGQALSKPAAGPIHGVIEGFYGRPWTWAEREQVVMAMGALGLDTYFYAPKNDPKHRASWREPYDGTTLGRFDRLRRVGEGVGVNVVWAVSPGLDIDPSAPADVGALLDKVSSIAGAAGIRDAALLMDDLDKPHDAALGAAHVALVKKLLDSMKARDPASRLWFVPTVYAGLAGTLSPEDHAYLAALSDLPAEVPLAWTGDGVFAAQIDIGGATNFGGVAGRSADQVWIWDNYPVNDVAVFRRLYTHPITGRDSLLPGSAGLVSNPMLHALASIPALASYAEMALDPAGYAADRSQNKPLASAALARTLADGPGATPALEAFFAELVHHDTLWPDEYASHDLAAAISAFQTVSAVGPSRRAAALDLATRLGRLVVAEVELRRALDRQALSDEIDAHARATAVTARVVLEALSGSRAELVGDANEALAARSRGACLWIAANQPAWRTLQDAIAKLVPTGDLGRCDATADPFVGADPSFAVVGQPWSATFTDPLREEGASYALVDSAGEGSLGGAIDAQGKISFTPPRLGRFRLVALRSGDAGVTARVFEVTAVETLPPAPPASAASGCGCALGEGPRGSIASASAAAFALALSVRRARRRRRRPGISEAP
ncbi:MAG: beta-N-acetylglucosaminidase domain-containing protein [Byssovorax sp.]